jgi:predicted transcriptional regulator
MATITINELATELDSTPREVRKFLRSVTPAENQPGKGHRWQIEKRALRGLKKQFAEHNAKPATDNQEAEHDDADLVTTDA